MALIKSCMLCAATVVTSLCCSPAAHAQMCATGPGCQKGLEIGCVPARRSFGYYPTMWRRWPLEGPTPATGPAPEAVTTPPAQQQPAAKVEPDQPTVTPDDATLFPEGPDSAAPKSNSDTDSMPPFDDPGFNSPKNPPSDTGLPGLPSDTGLPGLPSGSAPGDAVPPGSSGSSQRMKSPLSDDAPPVMPDDDPFKDDPPTTPETPAAKPTSPQSRVKIPVPGNDEPGRQAGLRWRARGGDRRTRGRNVDVDARGLRPRTFAHPAAPRPPGNATSHAASRHAGTTEPVEDDPRGAARNASSIDGGLDRRAATLAANGQRLAAQPATKQLNRRTAELLAQRIAGGNASWKT